LEFSIINSGGRIAIIPIALFHGFGAFVGQSIVNRFRHWRISKAVSLLENPQCELADEHSVKFRDKLEISKVGIPSRSGIEYDPFKYIFELFRDYTLDYFYPGGAPSYVRLCTDIEYRKKLLLKIGILNTQIEDLKKELDQRNIEY
jgi:hypothetical protein